MAGVREWGGGREGVGKGKGPQRDSKAPGRLTLVMESANAWALRWGKESSLTPQFKQKPTQEISYV